MNVQAQLDQAIMSSARTCLLRRAQPPANIGAEQRHMQQEGSCLCYSVHYSSAVPPYCSKGLAKDWHACCSRQMPPTASHLPWLRCCLRLGQPKCRLALQLPRSSQSASDAGATQASVSCQQVFMSVIDSCRQPLLPFSPAGLDPRLATSAAPYLITEFHCLLQAARPGTQAGSCGGVVQVHPSPVPDPVAPDPHHHT